MRVAIVSLLLTFALADSAFAQSGLFFNPREPVQAGETVKGLLMQANGLATLGDIYVQGVYEDDMFAYWAGSFNGQQYYYDIYSTYWRQGPVTYRHSSLTFQGDVVEGWVRQFGSYLDYNNFFGNDGVYYKRIIVKRNRNRNTNKRRQILYTYFVNMETLERSDSGSPSYIVIGDPKGVDLAKITTQKEKDLQLILEANPAFPNWRSTAFEPPRSVIVHNGAPENPDDNLLQLVEAEIGPLSVGSK
jgi:hypothetical protein